MVYPAFFGETFWNYSEVCKLVGARYTAAPLGLITVAAMLPRSWDVRLINRNTEDLSEADVAWADVVMTGGMLLQQADTLEIVTLAHKHAKHAVVGGPDATSSPHLLRGGHLCLREAETKARHSDSRHRVSFRRPGHLCGVANRARDRLSAWRHCCERRPLDQDRGNIAATVISPSGAAVYRAPTSLQTSE